MTIVETARAVSAALLTGATALTVDQHGMPVKVADTVPLQAQPFRPDQVRLLDPVQESAAPAVAAHDGGSRAISTR